MATQRQQAVIWAAAAVVGVWGVALAGYLIARSGKVTAEKVRAYVESVDLSKLSAAVRAKAIRELSDKINALFLEERQRMRMDCTAYQWFEQILWVAGPQLRGQEYCHRDDAGAGLADRRRGFCLWV